MKGVVVNCQFSGQPVRLMPGSKALELWELAKGPNGKKGTKQKPSYEAQFIHHMGELHKKYMKEIGNAVQN